MVTRYLIYVLLIAHWEDYRLRVFVSIINFVHQNVTLVLLKTIHLHVLLVLQRLGLIMILYLHYRPKVHA